jgi:hypothetical protein
LRCFDTIKNNACLYECGEKFQLQYKQLWCLAHFHEKERVSEREGGEHKSEESNGDMKLNGRYSKRIWDFLLFIVIAVLNNKVNFFIASSDIKGSHRIMT